MIVHNVEQGSEEWHQIRLVCPTASRFKDILTPPKKKSDSMSRTAFAYMAECFAERAIGEPVDGVSSPWMERGQRQESEALDFYRAFLAPAGAEVKRVGFVTLDAGPLAPGCSPDALVGEDGGLELKIHGAAKHAAFMFEPERFLAMHRAQVQGALWIAGRAWWHLVAYHPTMPPVVHRVEPDLEYIANLAERVAEFTAMLEDRLRKFGYQPQIASNDSEGPESPAEPESGASNALASPAESEAKLAEAVK